MEDETQRWLLRSQAWTGDARAFLRSAGRVDSHQPLDGAGGNTDAY